MVAFIILRTLYQDFARYNRVSSLGWIDPKLPTSEDEVIDTDESGWKMVHADVFRAPEHGFLLLSVLVVAMHKRVNERARARSSR